MQTPCPELWELDGAQKLPRDHPVRVHLENCDLCQASLLAFLAFDSENEWPEDDARDSLHPENVALADKALDQFIKDEIQTPRHKVPARPAWLLSMAAVLVAAGGLWLAVPTLQKMTEPQPPVMRGEDSSLPTEKIEFITIDRLKNGDLDLTWSTVPGATGYQVVFWTDELMEFARLGVLTETRQLVVYQDIPPPEKSVYFSVQALMDRGESLNSAMAEIPVIKRIDP